MATTHPMPAYNVIQRSPNFSPAFGSKCILLAATFLLALASIAYELLLGQTLSAFLGDTVLRYSVTIGLYMFAMGIGAFLAAGPLRAPFAALLRVEIALSVLGGGAIIFLFWFSSLGMPLGVFSMIAHGMIIVIGIFTGFEIPLLMELYQSSGPQRTERDSGHIVLGVDYGGAFAGALLFAFFFYPHAGLVATAFLVGLVNSTVAIMLVLWHAAEVRYKTASFVKAAAPFALVFGCAAAGLYYQQSIADALIDAYFLLP